MSTNSPLFDRIRVKPDQDRRQRPSCRLASGRTAARRRPTARRRAGCAPVEYWRFCLDHVREYNNSYNFFAGMSDDAVAKYQKEDITGHRPTWKMGSVGGVSGRRRQSRRGSAEFRGAGWAADDPFELFGAAGRQAAGQARPAAEGRKILNAQRRALDALGLEARRQARRYQGEVQGIGEAASSRRQWRRPQLRGPAAGDHPGL